MIPNWRFSNEPPGAEYRTTRTCHLHLVQHSSPEWQNPIAFRDFLRIHPDAARKHLELKRSLARQEYEIPSDYPAQKSEFVAGIPRLAHQEQEI